MSPEPRKVDVSFRTLLKVVAVVALAWIWLMLWQWLLIVLVAVFLAIALEPPVGWLTRQRWAAAVKLPLSATAWNERSWLYRIDILYGLSKEFELDLQHGRAQSWRNENGRAPPAANVAIQQSGRRALRRRRL